MRSYRRTLDTVYVIGGPNKPSSTVRSGSNLSKMPECRTIILSIMQQNQVTHRLQILFALTHFYLWKRVTLALLSTPPPSYNGATAYACIPWISVCLQNDTDTCNVLTHVMTSLTLNASFYLCCTMFPVFVQLHDTFHLALVVTSFPVLSSASSAFPALDGQNVSGRRQAEPRLPPTMSLTNPQITNVTII